MQSKTLTKVQKQHLFDEQAVFEWTSFNT